MLVTEIQRFCMHDGPGLRTVVFLSGCPLRCAWCHNPEAQLQAPALLYSESRCIGCGRCAEVCPAGAHSFAPDHRLDRRLCRACGRCADACPTRALRLSAKEMSVPEVVRVVLRDMPFYGGTGGVTLSGGEPLAQPEQALALLRACRDAGLSTAVETSGFFDAGWLPDLVRCVDLFLWDVKDTDSDRHRRYTGMPAGPALENLRAADALGAATVLRCITVQGVNADALHASAVARLYRSLNCCRGVEFLPCHMLSSSKYAQLGMRCTLEASAACPPELLEKMQAAFDAHLVNPRADL